MYGIEFFGEYCMATFFARPTSLYRIFSSSSAAA